MIKRATVRGMHPFTEYRSVNGLTQGQLADLLGVSRALVGLIESGERRIDADNIIEWERKTGIPREQLRPDLYQRAKAA